MFILAQNEYLTDLARGARSIGNRSGRGIDMTLLKITLRVLGLLACMTIVLCPTYGQYRASIQGVVTDPQGDAVSGATVTLKNLDTNQTLTATTDASGIYNFNALAASKYSLTVEKTGFKKKILDT